MESPAAKAATRLSPVVLPRVPTDPSTSASLVPGQVLGNEDIVPPMLPVRAPLPGGLHVLDETDASDKKLVREAPTANLKPLSPEKRPNSQAAVSPQDLPQDAVDEAPADIGARITPEQDSKEEALVAQIESKYAVRSCFILEADSSIRRLCIVCMENVWFDRICLTVIGANCVCLAAFDPLDKNCVTTRCETLGGFDKFFSIFFLMEMIIKMCAMGFWGERSYGADNWNRFDFVIVVTGMIDFLPGVEGGGINALRTFRVVRPLRALNRFPELRMIVRLIMDTIPMLASVGLLCFFIFFVFGILAVQLWNGLFRQRCFEADPHSTAYFETDGGEQDPYLCTIAADAQTGMSSCPPNDTKNSTFTVCRRNGPTPFFGAIHFDNIAAAWLVIFQCITMEAWVDIMYLVQAGYSYWAWIYFVFLIVVGAFFAVNLTLVVISAQYGAAKEAEMAAINASLDNEAAEQQQKRLDNIGMRRRTIWQMVVTCTMERTYYDEECAKLGNEMQAIKTSLAELSAEEKVEARARMRDLEVRLLKLDDGGELPDISTLQGGALFLRHIRIFVEGPIFGNSIMGFIILNVIMMASEHHQQPQGMTDAFAVLNVIFTVIFAVEMAAKLLVLGISEYLSSISNFFDATIVVMSVVELGLGGRSGLSVLRCFRLVRVFRMAPMLPSLQRQLLILVNTLSEVASFLVILVLFIYIYAILGMQIFGGNFTFDGRTDRKNFDTLIWAFTTVFQILTCEDWNVSMHAGVRALGFAGCLYYVTLLIFGNYILFNLFVAILIDGFGAEKDEEEDEQEKENDDKEEEQDDNKEQVEKKKNALVNRLSKSAVAQAALVVAGAPAIETPRQTVVHPLVTARGHHQVQAVTPRASGPVSESDTGIGHGSGTGTVMSTLGGVATAAEESPETDTRTAREKQRDLAFCFIPPDNPFRAMALKLVDLKSFDNFIMLSILLNSIALACERPTIEDGSAERSALTIASNVFNFIFSVEFLLKLLAFGVFIGPRAYISDWWNCLDGTIVGVSWINYILTWAAVDGGEILQLLKIFRMLRAIRPLRAVNKLPELKKVVNTLVASAGPIGTTLILVGIFFFIFSILGVQMLAGKLYFCSSTQQLSEDDIRTYVFTKQDCLTRGGRWINQQYNFDHLFNGLMTLFVLASVDGWVVIMYAGVDAVEVDMQPQENHNEAMILYYVAFILLGGFFILNMFVGVIVENFQHAQSMADAAREKQLKEQQEAEAAAASQLKEELEAALALSRMNNIQAELDVARQGTDTQLIEELEAAFAEATLDYQREEAEAAKSREIAERELAEAAEAAKELAYWEPAEGGPALCGIEQPEEEFYAALPPLRRATYDMIYSHQFESIIAGFISANVLTMASEHYDMSHNFIKFLEVTNYIFTVVFVFESFSRLVALFPYRFFLGPHRGWNNFDLFIVMVSIVGIYFDHADATLPVNPTLLRLLRILRVARILKLLKSAKDLMMLLTAVINSLRQVGNLALLLFLLFFIYAALGIELFGRIGCTSNNVCHGFSKFANFDDFFNAMLTLFRLTTGDNWNGMMMDGLRTAPDSLGSPPCSFDLNCTENCCNGCNDDIDCKENCCANRAITVIYFCSFVLLAQFVMLNLVVAVLMQELESAEDAEAEAEAEASAREPSSEDGQDAAGPYAPSDGDVEPGSVDDVVPWEVEEPVRDDASEDDMHVQAVEAASDAQTIETSFATERVDPEPIRVRVPQQTGQTCVNPNPEASPGIDSEDQEGH